MNKLRPILVFASTGIAGGITPWLVPSEWLSYFFGASLVGLLIFGILAGASAENEEQGRAGLIWFFVIGTSNPTGKINDPQALALFFLALTYLAGLTAGAFGAVHA